MSMQSHLAELEKRHQALEDEINECLTHPAVDDLKIVELKRRKLQVKDEIERLREAGLVELSENRLKISRAGAVLANEVFAVFV